MIGDSGSWINFDWEVVCSFLRLKWLILEIVFNVLMKLCPWGSFSMKILFIVSIFGDSHCEDFLFLEIFSWWFFFLKFFLWNCSIVKICSITHLWGLKSLCCIFDSGSLVQGWISKWILTQGWSLELWLTQGQIWSLKWFFDFGYLFGLAFRTIELILLFLNVSLKF